MLPIFTLLLSLPLLHARAIPLSRGYPSIIRDHLRTLLPDSPYVCSHSLQSIPLDRVNDGFCDCPLDPSFSSDECGTSACPLATFFCANVGHFSLNLSSIFVDDGHCDCCDGSDEPKGTCTPQCHALGRSDRKELRTKIKEGKLGQIAREEAKRKAKEQVIAWEAELQELLKKSEEWKVREENVRKAIELAEKISNEKDEKVKEWDSKVNERRENERLELEKEKEKAMEATQESTNNNNENSNEKNNENSPDIKIDNDNNNNEDGQENLIEENAEVSDDIRELEVDHSSDDVAMRISDESDLPSTSRVLNDIHRKKPKSKCSKSKSDEDYLSLHELPLWREAKQVATDASNALRALRDEVSAAEKTLEKIKELQENLSADYGPDRVWLGVKGDCAQIKSGEFVYEVCLFEKAKQGHTSLGNFAGFSHNVMKFDKGQKCWNGPERSASVTLECGSEYALKSVEEPAMCEYAVKAINPALCSEQYIDDLQEKLHLLGGTEEGTEDDTSQEGSGWFTF